jgi:triosephosphate isomerase
MPRKILAGNWKMNGSRDEAVRLATGILEGLAGPAAGDLQVILAPPFVFLETVQRLVAAQPRVSVAAQDCSAHAAGAYTGEVSAAMLRSAGAAAVIIGHSERRMHFSETNDVLKEKLKRAFENGLMPIFCCGESQDERAGGRHFETVRRQIEESLDGIGAEAMAQAVIAYEPVWAIGTGLTATPEQAQEMHAFLRTLLSERFPGTGAGIPLLYGGSCNEKNAAGLFAQPDIDGGLIGGASLKAESFLRIAASF